jgi:hypothetical protein
VRCAGAVNFIDRHRVIVIPDRWTRTGWGSPGFANGLHPAQTEPNSLPQALLQQRQCQLPARRRPSSGRLASRHRNEHRGRRKKIRERRCPRRISIESDRPAHKLPHIPVLDRAA